MLALYIKVPFGITLALHSAAEQIASNRNRYFWLGFMLTLTGIILYMLFGRKAMIISALGSLFLGLAALV